MGHYAARGTRSGHFPTGPSHQALLSYIPRTLEWGYSPTDDQRNDSILSSGNNKGTGGRRNRREDHPRCKGGHHQTCLCEEETEITVSEEGQKPEGGRRVPIRSLPCEWERSLVPHSWQGSIQHKNPSSEKDRFSCSFSVTSIRIFDVKVTDGSRAYSYFEPLLHPPRA